MPFYHAMEAKKMNVQSVDSSIQSFSFLGGFSNLAKTPVVGCPARSRIRQSLSWAFLSLATMGMALLLSCFWIWT